MAEPRRTGGPATLELRDGRSRYHHPGNRVTLPAGHPGTHNKYNFISDYIYIYIYKNIYLQKMNKYIYIYIYIKIYI